MPTDQNATHSKGDLTKEQRLKVLFAKEFVERFSSKLAVYQCIAQGKMPIDNKGSLASQGLAATGALGSGAVSAMGVAGPIGMISSVPSFANFVHSSYSAPKRLQKAKKLAYQFGQVKDTELLRCLAQGALSIAEGFSPALFQTKSGQSLDSDEQQMVLAPLKLGLRAQEAVERVMHYVSNTTKSPEKAQKQQRETDDQPADQGDTWQQDQIYQHLLEGVLQGKSKSKAGQVSDQKTSSRFFQKQIDEITKSIPKESEPAKALKDHVFPSQGNKENTKDQSDASKANAALLDQIAEQIDGNKPLNVALLRDELNKTQKELHQSLQLILQQQAQLAQNFGTATSNEATQSLKAQLQQLQNEQQTLLTLGLTLENNLTVHQGMISEGISGLQTTLKNLKTDGNELLAAMATIESQLATLGQQLAAATQHRQALASNQLRHIDQAHQITREVIETALRSASPQVVAYPQTWQVTTPISSFTGRESELGQFDDEEQLIVDGSIHQMMSRKTSGTTFSVLSQMNTISGLGGVGKTETARMYAYLYDKYYDNNAIEINAENASTLSESFRQAASKLHLPTTDERGKPQAIARIVSSVYRYFADSLQQRCLFIFDNAENYQEIKDYLPDQLSSKAIKKLYLLITSRNRDWQRHLKAIQVLPLDVWPAEEATRFVKSELGLKDSHQDKAIEQLIGNQCLQYLPLALRQAVAYIREEQKRRTKFSISDYLAKWSGAKEQVLSFTYGGSDNSYQQTVLTTWRITLDKLKDQPDGELALSLLDKLAYLSPQGILEALFTAYEGASREALTAALTLLKQYCLIDEELVIQGNQTIKIHRLVQEVIRLSHQALGTTSDHVRATLALLSPALVDDASDRENYSRRLAHLPHGLLALEIAQEVLGKGDAKVLNLQANIAGILRAKGDYQRALSELDAVYAQEIKTRGPEHGETLTTRHNRASVLQDLGRLDEALAEYEAVYAQEIKTRGPEHGETLTTRHNRALVLKDLGRLDAALAEYEAVYAQEIKTRGPEHGDTLTTRSNRALVLHDLGRLDAALAEYEAVYAKRQETLGPEHGSTLATRHNRALVLKDLGRLDEALAELDAVYAKRQETLGPEHVKTLTTRSNRALVLHDLGRLDAALAELDAVYAKRQETLGPEHGSTLATRHNRALVLKDLGRLDEALAEYDAVYAKRQETRGPDHGDTLATRHDRALVLKDLGRLDEALAEYDAVYAQEIKTRGPEHRNTLTTQHCQAWVLRDLGRFEAALAGFEAVYDKEKMRLGANHLNTLITRARRAWVLHDLGRHTEALAELEAVYEEQHRQLGDDHPRTLMTRYYRAEVYRTLGQTVQAKAELHQVYARQQSKLGANHPDTSQTHTALTLLESGQTQTVSAATSCVSDVVQPQWSVLIEKEPMTKSSRVTPQTQQAAEFIALQPVVPAPDSVDGNGQDTARGHGSCLSSCCLRFFSSSCCSRSNTNSSRESEGEENVVVNELIEALPAMRHR